MLSGKKILWGEIRVIVFSAQRDFCGILLYNLHFSQKFNDVNIHYALWNNSRM